jgi:RimJ/RimL family protein N-acetyltransferase
MKRLLRTIHSVSLNINSHLAHTKSNSLVPSYNTTMGQIFSNVFRAFSSMNQNEDVLESQQGGEAAITKRFSVRLASTEQDFEYIYEAVRKEGWEPGSQDVRTYVKVDPSGFYLGVLNDNEIIGCISGVRYEEAKFGFIGFYITDPKYRGMGYGIALWKEAMKHLDGCTVGLDALLSQIPRYSKSGFMESHRHCKYQGVVSAPNSSLCNNTCSETVLMEMMKDKADKQHIMIVDAASSINFQLLKAFLRQHFPSDRDKLLEGWLESASKSNKNDDKSDHVEYLVHYKPNSSVIESCSVSSCCSSVDEVVGFSGIRRSPSGYRIAPL